MNLPSNLPSADHVIAFTALAGLGAIAWGLLFWPIPAANTQAMTFILGAIAGALGVPTTRKLTTKTPKSPLDPETAP